MKMFQLTERSKELAKVKEIGGKNYIFCTTDGEKELWLSLPEQPQMECVRCGYVGSALETHHIDGRKNSNRTVLLCANCHREEHFGRLS